MKRSLLVGVGILLLLVAGLFASCRPSRVTLTPYDGPSTRFVFLGYTNSSSFTNAALFRFDNGSDSPTFIKLLDFSVMPHGSTNWQQLPLPSEGLSLAFAGKSSGTFLIPAPPVTNRLWRPGFAHYGRPRDVYFKQLRSLFGGAEAEPVSFQSSKPIDGTAESL